MGIFANMGEKKDASGKTPELEVLICTLGRDGLEKVKSMLPVPIDGIGFIVSCQDPRSEINEQEAKAFDKREDVTFRIHKDAGLSRNRNHALDMAQAPVVVIADDDIQYYPEALEKVSAIMKANPELDILAFRYDGPKPKTYPLEEHNLCMPYKNYNPASIELAFRRESIRTINMRFSELAGIGAPYLKSSEESIFLERCLQKGLKGKFVPLTVCSHREASTGEREAANPGHIRAKGAFIRIKYGLFSGLARCVVTAFRSPAPTHKALLWSLQGYLYSIKHNSRL